MLTQSQDVTDTAPARSSLLKRALRIEWLGQTLASIFWIASVFTYGISSTGDWLQLLAASTWLVANLAALGSSDSASSGA